MNDRFSTDLALLLSNRVAKHQALGLGIALADASQSVDLLYAPEYAAALHVYSQLLADLGRHADALPPACGAVDHWEELASVNREVYRPAPARGLLNLAGILRKLGLHPAAKDRIRKAVGIFRDLATRSPEKFNPEYATALHTTARVYMGLEEYLKVLGESRIELACTLHNLSMKLDVTPEAVVHGREEVDLFKSLLDAGPTDSAVRQRLVARTSEATDDNYALPKKVPVPGCGNSVGSLTHAVFSPLWRSRTAVLHPDLLTPLHPLGFVIYGTSSSTSTILICEYGAS
ncbi:hypothetical protein C8J57DRAFT_1536478 [Mycena rebaudengoi]|nr:hypothetical protein C8J57DRAFT_1536478 [Mycena rebaudengoi]